MFGRRKKRPERKRNLLRPRPHARWGQVKPPRSVPPPVRGGQVEPPMAVQPPMVRLQVEGTHHSPHAGPRACCWVPVFVDWAEGRTDTLDFQGHTVPDRVQVLLEHL